MTIKEQLGEWFQARDLAISELTLFDETNFKAEVLERWPELIGKTIWTFSLPEKQVIEMSEYICEKHWEAANYGF